MNKILDILFRSEQVLLMERAEEACYIQENEALQAAAKQMREQLTSEQVRFWTDYTEKQERLHDHERQMEFERGFYLGGKLILEILIKRDSET